MRKKLLSGSQARLLIAVSDKPGSTTKELIQKFNIKRPPTAYAILSSLNDKQLVLINEKHGGKAFDGRPSRTYSLSPNGEKHAELYRKLFALEEES